MSAYIEHKSMGWSENLRSHQNFRPSVWKYFYVVLPAVWIWRWCL